MICIDSSVLLAHLMAEDVRPPEAPWAESLISSRLAQYEVWRTIHRDGIAATHGEAAEDLLAGLNMLELSPPVLELALQPLPQHARTFDALHWRLRTS